MLADRLRMRRPVAAYSSHTLVAGYNNDSKYPNYGYVSGVYGSLTPSTAKGATITSLSHLLNNLTFQVSGNYARNFFSKIEIWSSSGALLRTINTGSATYSQSSGYTQWQITTPNPFTPGASYEIRIYP